jgi:hypothetical protein
MTPDPITHPIDRSPGDRQVQAALAPRVAEWIGRMAPVPSTAPRLAGWHLVPGMVLAGARARRAEAAKTRRQVQQPSPHLTRERGLARQLVSVRALVRPRRAPPPRPRDRSPLRFRPYRRSGPHPFRPARGQRSGHCHSCGRAVVVAAASRLRMHLQRKRSAVPVSPMGRHSPSGPLVHRPRYLRV